METTCEKIDFTEERDAPIPTEELMAFIDCKLDQTLMQAKELELHDREDDDADAMIEKLQSIVSIRN